MITSRRVSTATPLAVSPSGAGYATALSADGGSMLYHATTYKNAKLYRISGAIHAPVRGFTTLQAAMARSLESDGENKEETP
jgi:hypothetical protein